jgi:hypothetical protein
MACSKYVALACLCLAAVFALPSTADACSCIGGTPLCESFWKTPVVFSGEVLAIANSDPADPSRLSAQRRVRFRIDRAYRGTVSGEVDVYTGLGGGDCGFNFARGQKYLVFAGTFQGRLNTGICSPTKRLADAAIELAYLNDASTSPDRGRVFGEAKLWDRDGGSPAANRKVTIRGESLDRSVTTDAAGKFEVESVPAGKYQVELSPPKGWSGGGPLTIEMPDARACARADFHLQPDGRVHLKVANVTIDPAKPVALELIQISQDGKQADTLFGFGIAVATGDVMWEHVPPGRYVIALNVIRGSDRDQPYPATFYPGVSDRASAKVIEVGLGERVELPAFRLPDRHGFIAVRGSVVRPNASNVRGAKASLVSDEPHSRGRIMSTAVSDAEGRFTLGGVEGNRYRVRVSVEGKEISSEPFELTPATAPLLLVVR